MKDDKLDAWARDVMRTAFPDEGFPPMQATGEELRQRAESVPDRHLSDLGRLLTGRDGEKTYSFCDELLADAGGRVIPPDLPDARLCPACVAERDRRNKAAGAQP